MNFISKYAAIPIIFLWCLSVYGEQEPSFSATKYSRERDIVKTLLKEEIKEARTISKEPVQIDIALNDLNKDGKPEILAYLRHPYFCGVDGCWFLVYVQKDRRWQKILQLIIREEVSLSKSSTSGFVDLIVENRSIWGWSEGKYQFLRRLQ